MQRHVTSIFFELGRIVRELHFVCDVNVFIGLHVRV